MQNISAALAVCLELGLNEEQFYEAISSFKGAAKRQELLAESKSRSVYLDFAHAPSKVRATVDGFKEAFKDKKIIACLELHTFSSLNKEFMPQYKGSLEKADEAIVFYNPEVVAHKKLAPVDKDFIKECFQKEKLIVINNRKELESTLLSKKEDGIYLLMSSGNFSGMDVKDVANKILL
jgi:UDP-N-acetylmuramate-alanine ligase